MSTSTSYSTDFGSSRVNHGYDVAGLPVRENHTCVEKVCIVVGVIFFAALATGIKLAFWGFVIGTISGLAMGATDAALKGMIIAGIRFGFTAGFLGTACILGSSAVCCPQSRF